MRGERGSENATPLLFKSRMQFRMALLSTLSEEMGPSPDVFERDDIRASGQPFFKPVMGVWFGVERLDLDVPGTPIESDRFM